MSFLANLFQTVRHSQSPSQPEIKPSSQPEPTDEIVYSDSAYQIRKIWKWDVDTLSEDKETGFLITRTAGYPLSTFTFVTVDGTRLAALSFNEISAFHGGLARVAVNGQGYGYIDEHLSLVTPAQYHHAKDLKNGMAKVQRGKQWFFINKYGRAVKPGGWLRHYQEVGDYAEGLCRVSTFNPKLVGLAYHSDYRHMAGTWGFINEEGKEVIPPQYIYAYDFEDGISIAAKGKWTLNPKWDNQYNRGCYWTETELWGGIDYAGNTVIPFVFDEIKFFYDRTDIFMAHYGGWPEGGWGVIDRTGKWLAEPIFPDLHYEVSDDLLAFYEEDPVCMSGDTQIGIYDFVNRRVLFEPQFSDVSFHKNDIIVKVFDENLDRTITKIIDRSGNERFPSVYSLIQFRKTPYEVMIRDADSNKYGLVDQDGSVILPCIYETPHNGILIEQKRFHFLENGKQGVMDFDGNIIIPPVYLDIYHHTEPFMTVRSGTADHYKEGIITQDGKIVLPAEYTSIGWCRDNQHFFCCSDGYCEMYAIEEHS